MIEKKIQSASTDALISYVAAYRSIGINKNHSTLCMIELDKRRQDGDTTQYEKEIDNQVSIIRSIGKGSIVQVMEGSSVDNVINEIKKITPCMIFNKDAGLIHVGIIDPGTDLDIRNIPGVKEITPDKSFLSKVIG